MFPLCSLNASIVSICSLNAPSMARSRPPLFAAVAAPLNPAYTVDEFEFFMSDAEAQLVIVEANSNAAIKAASKLKIPIIEVQLDPTGRLELLSNGVELTKSTDSDLPSENDVALFLHTSGTTSRPKGVPLTHKNLMTSLSNITASYNLTTDDRAMVVMPLFHVHGLIGVSLSSLLSGGSLVIPSRFSASTFWQDQAYSQSTWYSAVPTIHQILLMRADSDNAPEKSFRFIRSCSAALAPSVFSDLENIQMQLHVNCSPKGSLLGGGPLSPILLHSRVPIAMNNRFPDPFRFCINSSCFPFSKT